MNLAFRGGEGGGAGEERGQLLDDVLHGLVEGPGGVRGDGGGDLDRDVVDVGAGQQRVGALEPAGGLVLAEDRLAEEVDVELDAVLADLGDGRAQLGVGGVDDQVADHFAEHAAGDRDDHLRQDRGHGAAEADGAAHVPGQERGHLRGQGGEVAGGDLQVLGADDAVDESDGEVEAVRVLQDPGELLGRGVNGDLRGFGEPAADQCDGVLGERGGLQHRGAFRDGGVLGGRCRCFRGAPLRCWSWRLLVLSRNVDRS